MFSRVIFPGTELLGLNDILAGDYIPDSLNFTNYINAFQTQPLLHYMLNSAIVGVLSTALEIVFALLAAYAIVFIPFRAKKVVFLLMMATMMIPGEVLVITNFQTIRSWDMLNTYQGLILPGLASTFGIFLFRQNMLQIPLELKEASTVAGVSEFGFFWKIVDHGSEYRGDVGHLLLPGQLEFLHVAPSVYHRGHGAHRADRPTAAEEHRGSKRLRHDGSRGHGHLSAHPTAHLLRTEAAAGGHAERRY